MNLQLLKRSVVALSLLAGVAQAAPQAAPPTEEQPASETPPEALPACPPGEEVVTPPPPPAPVAAPAPVKKGRHYNKVFAPNSVSITTGAGVGNYFGSQINRIDAGASWDARVTVGTRSIIALEAGYVGASNEVYASNPALSGMLNSNGVDGDFRLQLPYKVQPYIFSGVGWQRMALDNHTSTELSSTYNTHDDQITVPAGAGLAGYLGKHATLDLRGTYRYVGSNDMTIMTGPGALHQWIAQARIGYQF